MICFVLAVFFISCKKERACNCEVTKTGTSTTRCQTAGITFSLNLGLPLPVPIPPIVVSPAKDTTIVTSFSYKNPQKLNYENVSKRTLKKICQSAFEEEYSDQSSSVIPGTSTVTTTEAGKKAYSCEIE